jgi:hypothetical protein
MKDIDIKKLTRDPKLYYLLVPIVCAIWPLWVGVVSLPAAQKTWAAEQEQYRQIEQVIEQIQKFDPDRFIAEKDKGKAAPFSYPVVIEQVAKTCNIPSTEYKLQVGAVVKAKGGQQVQDADVTLRQVDIATFAKFISTMQIRWADLQCVSLKLTKQKGAADLWKADIDFKYYF